MITIYKCEVCGTESADKITIIACEERCSCDCEYDYKISINVWDELVIAKTCSKCGKHHSSNFDPDDFHKETLQYLWDNE